jgi:2-keto-3-deoxy-L-rhamnonate aldolase RhmA
MKSAQILKAKINGDGITTGVIASFHLWPELVEICKNAGLDYLIVDLEHGAYPDDLVAQVCALGRLIDFPVLIRPHSHDFATVRKILDLGPCGLMIAIVSDTEMLDEVRDAMYMPPRGKRRPGGPGNRWVTDYNYPTWVEEVENDFVVLAQIETLKGLENLDAIASHEIVTAIAVGPYDLAANLGVCWQPDAPALVEALQNIRAAGRRAGKNMWMIGDGATSMKAGFNFLCIAEPIALLEGTLKNLVNNLKTSTESGVKYEFGDNPV